MESESKLSVWNRPIEMRDVGICFQVGLKAQNKKRKSIDIFMTVHAPVCKGKV